mmetsp:Transcript_19945/g.36053  ORF Transcript_19945/g.36053 Transcript_19945/m.36053 type:complete len:98 (+) Transcript_19945:29-322(+)
MQKSVNSIRFQRLCGWVWGGTVASVIVLMVNAAWHSLHNGLALMCTLAARQDMKRRLGVPPTDRSREEEQPHPRPQNRQPAPKDSHDCQNLLSMCSI